MSKSGSTGGSPLSLQGSPLSSEKSPIQLLAGVRRQFLQDLRYQKKSQLTIDWYAKRLEKMETDTGAQTLEQLTRPALQGWILGIAETGSDAYVANCWRAMRGFFGWCRRMGYDWHPSMVNAEGRFSLSKPTEGEEHPDAFTDEEAQRLLAWPLKPRDAMIVRLGLQTGLRYPSELLRLELDSIDRRPGMGVAGYLDVLGKRNKRRWVPVSPGLMKVLDHYIARVRPAAPSAQLVLTESGRPLTPLGLNSVMRRISAATGVHVHAYKFRHTFATEYLRRNRNDIEGLRKILGHDDYKTLRGYLKLVRDDIGEGWSGRAPFE